MSQESARAHTRVQPRARRAGAFALVKQGNGKCLIRMNHYILLDTLRMPTSYATYAYVILSVPHPREPLSTAIYVSTYYYICVLILLDAPASSMRTNI